MKRLLLSTALLMVAAVGAGCSGQTVREGIWKLSFKLTFSDTGESADALVKEREVLVQLARENRGDDVIEVIEIAPVTEVESIVPMYGEIRAGRINPKPLVTILSSDKDWAWQMFGYVRDPETIVGQRCDARTKHARLVLEGRWDMVWLRDA